MKSLAFSLLRTVLDDPGATSQSDLPRSLPIQSDPLERHTKVARDLSPGDTKNRPWSDFPERHLQSNHNASSELATQLLILRHFSPESALISLRTGSTIIYTTTFVLGALKTPNIISGQILWLGLFLN
ncbi:hypothetical protein IGI04_002862 [Brassica rapa subsp. trilocularis]|uniref:Uncharacterized protein n=1 Tax=Brassica rapa subsp. trilocularis TaxID=1813537 RepID=A0ABQ7NWS8_BRACM|nr:hypothetical protein IGI04_002862 [Brassica rapa subsp. trilocularis]